MRPQSVDLHIEELVLDGFGAADQYRIGDSLMRELARLMGAQGVPRSCLHGGVIADLDGGVFHVAPDANAESVGIGVAHCTYERLVR